MKIKHLILWNIRLQVRYGFYLLYFILTALYCMVIGILPDSWRPVAVAGLIFSDPAAMGLFFMGAIVLLEKSERVNSAFAVLPLSPLEYVISKVVSLSTVAIAVAVVLAVTAGMKDIAGIIFGTLLSSTIFTLIGIIIATKIKSLNQFVIATMPVEVVSFVPMILYLLRITPDYMKIYPVNVSIDMIMGNTYFIPGIVLTIFVAVVLTCAACRCVSQMWKVKRG